MQLVKPLLKIIQSGEWSVEKHRMHYIRNR